MANFNAFAVPQEKKHYREDEWFEVKPDACWLYLYGGKSDEDTTLQGVMRAIERKYGLRASLVISASLTWRKAKCKHSPRTWKSKFKQWGYTKNIPTRIMQWVVAKEKQRTEKGESITFFYKRIKIEPRTILNSKKRRSNIDDTVLTHDSKPSGIAYYPESVCSESSFSEKETGVSTLSLDHACSGCEPLWAAENNSSYRNNRIQFPLVDIIDGWLSDNDEPLPRYHLFQDVSLHEDAIMNHHKALFFKISELECSSMQHLPPDNHLNPGLSATQRLGHSFDLCGLDDHLCIYPQPSVNIDQRNSTPEDDALDHLLSCAVTLAKYQCKYQELAPSTMEKHFAVAKAHENMGHYFTAEYHCRRSIDRYCGIKAKRFPYTLSPNSSRHEESFTFLLRALTTFIIEFNANSLDRNAWLFQHMELLYTVLIMIQRERFDAGFSLCMHHLRATLALPDSDEEVSTIYPQLFIHGFQLAHESSLLGFIETAAWMYDSLLRCCSEHLDVAHHAKRKAIAHARYSVLLRRQGEWRTSAYQLLLACEVMTSSASSDDSLYDQLQNDFRDLQPCLEQTLTEKLRKSLDRLQPQVPLPGANISGEFRGLSIDKFLNAESPFTPERLAIHEDLAFQQLELIVSGEPAVEKAPSEKAPSEKAPTVVSSTWSTHESSSSGIGVSWSKNCGEHLGIYDWDELITCS